MHQDSWTSSTGGLDRLLHSSFADSPLYSQRKAALDELISVFKAPRPSRKRTDRWHFPDLASLPIPETLACAESFDMAWIQSEIKRYGLENAISIVLVDGCVVSEIPDMPPGVSVKYASNSPDEVQVNVPVRAASVHGQAQKTGLLKHHPFSLLNAAFFNDAVLINVSPNTKVERPLVIVSATTGTGLSCSRIQVRGGAGSQLQLVELFLSIKQPDLAFPLTDVELENDANLHRILIFGDSENMHKTTMVLCKTGSSFVSDTVMIRDATLCRDETRVSLTGEHSSVVLRGVSVCLQDSSAHSQWYVDHQSPKTTSEVRLKTVVSDQANGNFRGHVYIGENAEKTASDMYANALVLSPDAQNHAQPRLEIYNPDVKATHGNTVGHLEIAPLFYLMARGIPYAEASTLITLAFCRETLLCGQAPVELKAAVDSMLTTTLKDALFRSKPPANPVVVDEINVEAIRNEFPILSNHRPHGQKFVYLDSGATTQKPTSVLDAMNQYYNSLNSNIHRGVYQLAETATVMYEQTRAKVAELINARSSEIVYCKGTTEAINLLANVAVNGGHLGCGDEVVVSQMEHHSNIVPWQIACKRAGAKLVVTPITADGYIDLSKYKEILSPRTKIVSIMHVSNVLGTINPIQEMAKIAHDVKSDMWFVCDGAQAIAHIPVDVKDLGVDFYALSAHKMYGPMGIGCLYGRHELLDSLPPYQGGGDMIESVTFEETVYAKVPQRFEAGTPDVGGVIGLGACVDYLLEHDLVSIRQHELGIMEYALNKLRREVIGIKILGPSDPQDRSGAIAFTITLNGIQSHAHDIGTVVDQWGVAIRAGHHCCQPLHDHLGIDASARASLSIHTNKDDVDMLVRALQTQLAPSKGVKPPTKDLEQLYTDVVVRENNNRTYRKVMRDYTHTAHGRNPVCGDNIIMYAKVENGIIQDVSYSGSGCAVSQASASLLAQLIQGKSVDSVSDYFDSFSDLISIQTDSIKAMDDHRDELGADVCALAGLGRFPARVKCATLSWHALLQAL